MSLLLASVQMSSVWVVSKALQFLSSWNLQKFLLITQGDLRVHSCLFLISVKSLIIIPHFEKKQKQNNMSNFKILHLFYVKSEFLSSLWRQESPAAIQVRTGWCCSLQVWTESLHLTVLQTRSLVMNSDSDHHSTIWNHHHLLMGQQLDALDKAVSDLQVTWNIDSTSTL